MKLGGEFNEYSCLVSNAKDLIDRKLLKIEGLAPNEKFLGIIKGTGWDIGIGQNFEEEAVINYMDLKIPGAEMAFEGHEKFLRIGKLNGKRVILISKVHANENPTDPNIVFGLRIVIDAIRDRLSCLLLTNGVGSLCGEMGEIKAENESTIYDANGNPIGGGLFEEIFGPTLANKKGNPISPGTLSNQIERHSKFSTTGLTETIEGTAWSISKSSNLCVPSHTLTKVDDRGRIIDALAELIRGKKKQDVFAGDVAVVTNFLTLSLSGASPLAAGEFIDPMAFLQGKKEKFAMNAKLTEMATGIVKKHQDGKCSQVNYFFVKGPQFESSLDKAVARLMGGDVIAMSFIPELCISTLFEIPVFCLVLVTNPMISDGHTHEGNVDMGKEKAPLLWEILNDMITEID